MTDRRIADFIEANAPLLRDYSSQQLADAINVSQSSIVKFAQRLGFKGYPDLKLTVHEEVTREATVQEVTDRRDAVQANPLPGDSLAQARSEADRHTRQVNDSETMTAAASAIAKAHTVYLAGMDIDGDIVETFSKRIRLLGQRCITSHQGSELLGIISAATRRDVLIVVCGEGQCQQWIPGCRGIREAGGQVIAVSRQRRCGLAGVATHTLLVAARNDKPHIDDLVYDSATRNLLAEVFLEVLASRTGLIEKYAANRLRIRGGDGV